jgi:hypothetical protein
MGKTWDPDAVAVSAEMSRRAGSRVSERCMKMWKNHRALGTILLFSAVLTGSMAMASPTSGNSIVVKDVLFRAGSGSAIQPAKLGGFDAVAVDGAMVTIGLRAVMEKTAGKSALVSWTIAVRPESATAHRFAFSLGKLGAVYLTEDETKASVLPKLAGATSYEVRHFEKGKLVASLGGQTGTLSLADLDLHAGTGKVLEIRVAYGEVAKDAWSVTLTQGASVVVLTPENVVETLADAPLEIGVQSTGLSAGFVLQQRGITLRPI